MIADTLIASPLGVQSQLESLLDLQRTPTLDHFLKLNWSGFSKALSTQYKLSVVCEAQDGAWSDIHFIKESVDPYVIEFKTSFNDIFYIVCEKFILNQALSFLLFKKSDGLSSFPEILYKKILHFFIADFIFLLSSLSKELKVIGYNCLDDSKEIQSLFEDKTFFSEQAHSFLSYAYQIQVTIDEDMMVIPLFFSQSTYDKLYQRLSKNFKKEKFLSEEAKTKKIQCTAILPVTTVTIEELENLQVGDLIRLPFKSLKNWEESLEKADLYYEDQLIGNGILKNGNVTLL